MPLIELQHTGYIKKELPNSFVKIGLSLLVIGIALGILSYIFEPARAVYGYLTSFIFLVTIGIGSLFLVALEYVAGVVWSVPFRRIAEFFSSIIPFLIILIIPLFFGMNNLFIWTHPNVVAKDVILQKKEMYLNIPFFIIRSIVILLLWSLFYFLITRNSRKQDFNGEQNLTSRNIKLSAVFILIFAFTISIFSFDWLMSMEPHWYSTIFGVYLFADAVWVSFAVLTLSSVILYQKGYLTNKIKKDHFYSLGTWMFAFTIFWAYIAFSQYMLQWYGNLPEEIIYYTNRWYGPWKAFSLGLVIAHFIVPFLILLPRRSKTNFAILKFAAIWIIVVQFYDAYWLVMPEMINNGFKYNFSLWDFTFPIAAVGLIIFLFGRMVKKYNLFPIGDPKLKRTFEFYL
jgi:hypothetical protein